MRMWMKKHNIGVWVLSFVLAVMFLLYVDITQDAERDKSLTIYPTFDEEAALLSEKDIVVTGGMEGAVLNLRIRGKASDLALCTNSSVRVVPRLNAINGAGEQKVYYTIEFPEQVGSRVSTSWTSVGYFTLTTDKIERKTVDVELKPGNIQVSAGYTLSRKQVEPDQIKVRGPSEQLKRVARAQVSPVKEELDRSEGFQARIVLVDAHGDEIVSDSLVFDPEEVTVILTVSRVKEVPLRVELIEGGGAREKDTQLEIKPATVTLSGDPAVLDALNVITLESVDLAELTENQTYTFIYPILIPNDVECKAKLEAEVTLSLTGLASRTFDVESITVIGESPPEGFEVKQVTQTLSLTLRGPKADMASVSLYNIRVVADLTGVELARGQQSVPAKVYVDGFPGVSVLGEARIDVTVEEAVLP